MATDRDQDDAGDPPATIDGALAGARPTLDPVAAEVSRARVAEALFGAAAGPPAIGRFQLLERLGAGGAGKVYRAYDPELDRAVALKLVRVPAARQGAAIAEARALARLAHPHVVAVHDVGVIDEHVYIVMELVRGETLRKWGAARRSRRDVLAVYRQAGEGLAAAHRAGLVHRDFKPDNVVVGSDGRARVVDFGLAIADRDAAGPAPIAGTPGYMAPEQRAGGAVGPAADQYAYATALAETLSGEHASLPRWIDAVVRRARADDPAARFPSMEALLRALGRDPARVWQRRALATGVVAAGALAFLAGQAGQSTASEACAGGPAALAATWAPDARRAALDRIAGLDAYGAVLAPQLAGWLDDHDARWLAGHRGACLAHRRGEHSDALLDARMACLERGRAALATTAELVTDADAAGLPQLAIAVRSLPDPDRCGDLDALVADVAPPPPERAAAVAAVEARIERASMLVHGGRYAEAVDEAAAAVAAARAADHPPALAEALVVEGRARMEVDDLPGALSLFEEATTTALAAGAEALAIEAWARRAWAQGTSGDPDAALAGLELIEAIAARPAAAGFPRALLDNNLGSVELARGRRDAARPRFARAIEASAGAGEEHAVELVNAHANLAIATDDPEARTASIDAAIAELTRLVGADHPQTLELRLMRSAMTTDLRDARDHLAPAIARYQELHATRRANVTESWLELAWLHAELGDLSAAAAAARNATALPKATAFVALWSGDLDRAAAELEAALAAWSADDRWWNEIRRGELEVALGVARRGRGDLRGAREVLAVAVRRLDTASAMSSVPAYRRRLGRARAELAALGDTTHADAARAWMREVGHPAAGADAGDYGLPVKK